jgi:hypothetical protein
MARGPSFTPIPAVPQSGLTDWQFRVLSALKEDVELLTGARANGALRALTKSQFTVADAPTQTMQQVTAEVVGFTISGVNVPSLDDYAKLVTNVQQLANDVAQIRNTLNTLIQQLKA